MSGVARSTEPGTERREEGRVAEPGQSGWGWGMGVGVGVSAWGLNRQSASTWTRVWQYGQRALGRRELGAGGGGLETMGDCR